MALQRISKVLLTCGVAWAGVVGTAVAGPITPPAGPVAPTHKTLSEVQPRRAVQSLPGNATNQHIISQPGSYYLTGDITGVSGKAAIRITAHHVTLDLSGFTMTGATGALQGIVLAGGVSNVAITNGTLTGWPETSIEAGTAGGVRIERVRAYSSLKTGMSAGWFATVVECEAAGNADYGIFTNDRAIVEDCKSINNGLDGFRTGHQSRVEGCVAAENGADGFELGNDMTVSSCTAAGNAGVGIRAGNTVTLTGCTATSNEEGGVLAGNAVTATGCTFASNSVFGIRTFGNGCLITGCTARGNVGDGINVFGTSAVLQCVAQGNQGGEPLAAGIRLSGSANRADSNMLNGNAIGLDIDGTNNLVVRNSFSFNPVRIEEAPGNNVAAIVVTPGTAFDAPGPWVNFAH